MQIHDRRELPSNSNQDIDQAKTSENYVLIECDNYHKAIDDRIKALELKKAVRHDAVLMCQFLVTSGPEFFQNMMPEKEKAFFEQPLKFIQDRYGKENVFSAVVHKDEKTPHMSVSMPPIFKGSRLTAKTLIDKKDIALQNDFHASVGHSWGLQRGQSREEKRRHLATEDFKIKTRQEELERQKNELLPELEQAVQRYNKMGAGRRIMPEEVCPKVLEAGGLFKKQGTENAHQVADRLNQEIVTPLNVALRAKDDKLQKLPGLQKAAEKYRNSQTGFCQKN
jgi:hypothetical protein